MCFRVSVPDDSKHVLDGRAVVLTKHNCRMPKFFNHHITFGGVVELDVSYRHEFHNVMSL